MRNAATLLDGLTRYCNILEVGNGSDRLRYRQFAGLGGTAGPSGRVSILRFRHLLEPHELVPKMLEAVNATLATKGLMLKEGTAIAATLIAAPNSTKNSTGTRDPEMHQTKKGNQWY